jgi:hypothetical protein
MVNKTITNLRVLESLKNKSNREHVFRELLGRIDNVGRQKIDAFAMTHGLVREIGRQYD